MRGDTAVEQEKVAGCEGLINPRTIRCESSPFQALDFDFDELKVSAVSLALSSHRAMLRGTIQLEVTYDGHYLS